MTTFRNKARECGISWEEYWDFLDDFADLTTLDGLQKLEMYLKDRQKQVDIDQADGQIAEKKSTRPSPISNNNNNDGSLSETIISQEDSVEDLNNYFKKLSLSSPTSPHRVPSLKLFTTESNEELITRDDEKFFSPSPSSENIAISLGTSIEPHQFGNSTMPNSFDDKTPIETVTTETDCVLFSDVRKDNEYRDNGVYNVDGWDSDESCDTYYTAANSPPLHAEMVTPPSSPVFMPVFIAG